MEVARSPHHGKRRRDGDVPLRPTSQAGGSPVRLNAEDRVARPGATDAAAPVAPAIVRRRVLDAAAARTQGELVADDNELVVRPRTAQPGGLVARETAGKFVLALVAPDPDGHGAPLATGMITFDAWDAEHGASADAAVEDFMRAADTRTAQVLVGIASEELAAHVEATRHPDAIDGLLDEYGIDARSARGLTQAARTDWVLAQIGARYRSLATALADRCGGRTVEIHGESVFLSPDGELHGLAPASRLKRDLRPHASRFAPPQASGRPADAKGTPAGPPALERLAPHARPCGDDASGGPAQGDGDVGGELDPLGGSALHFLGTDGPDTPPQRHPLAEGAAIVFTAGGRDRCVAHTGELASLKAAACDAATRFIQATGEPCYSMRVFYDNSLLEQDARDSYERLDRSMDRFLAHCETSYICDPIGIDELLGTLTPSADESAVLEAVITTLRGNQQQLIQRQADAMGIEAIDASGRGLLVGTRRVTLAPGR